MERSYGFSSNYFQNIYISPYRVSLRIILKTPVFDANTTEPVLWTLLLTKSEAKTPDFDANTEPVLRILLLTKNEAKTPDFEANTKPVLRILFLTKSEAKTPDFDAN